MTKFLKLLLKLRLILFFQKKELLRKNNETCSSRGSVGGGSSVSGSVVGDDDTESVIDSTAGDPGAPDPADLLDGFPDNIDDMVTVDATGIYGEEDNDEVRASNCSASDKRQKRQSSWRKPHLAAQWLSSVCVWAGGLLNKVHPNSDSHIAQIKKKTGVTVLVDLNSD